MNLEEMLRKGSDWKPSSHKFNFKRGYRIFKFNCFLVLLQ